MCFVPIGSARSLTPWDAAARVLQLIRRGSPPAVGEENLMATKRPAPSTKKSAPAKATAPAKKAAAPAKGAAKPAPVKKAPAKKAPVKKAPAKKVAAKASPAKKASAAKPAAAARTAPAKKAPAKAAPVKAPASKTSPAKAVPVKKAAATKVPDAAASKGSPTKKQTSNRDAGPVVGPSPYDAPFLDAQRAALIEERETLAAQAEALKAEAEALARDREPGDVQFDDESGEGDTLAVERDFDLARAAAAMATIEEIDAALARIDAGTYGVCEYSGQPIPKERLRAIPYARERVEFKTRSFR